MNHEKEQEADLPRVRRLSLVEAAEFLARTRSKELIQLKVSSMAYGLECAGELTALILLGLPLSSLHRRSYTSQLLELEVEPSEDYSTAVASLISHHLLHGRPKVPDLFYDGPLTEELYEAFRSVGMRHVSKSLFEWANPNITFYSYKITAEESNRYYYGISRVQIPNASLEQCHDDGYWGSGGPKFQRWKKEHRGTVEKKVIATYARRAEALRAERELVGTRWRSDPLCFNRRAGGAIEAPKSRNLAVSHCEIHGFTLHKLRRCQLCT